MANVTIIIDAESALGKRDVQAYIPSLLERGVNVEVLTERYDNEYIRTNKIDQNDLLLWSLVDVLKIPRKNVRFTNKMSKFPYLEGLNTMCYLTESFNMFNKIKEKRMLVVPINVNIPTWTDVCDKLLKDRYDL